jgi:hypothetical protein
MHLAARRLLAVGPLVLALSLAAAQGAEQGEMVVNPFYKYWSNCKPGSTVTLLEKTKLTGPDKNFVPEGIDEKHIHCKLLSVTPEHAVVEFVVTEREFLSSIETAPTKKIYPAKVTKGHLLAGLHGVEPKVGNDTLEVLGKKLQCTTYSGVEKKDGSEAEHMIWLSEEVPGGVVKHTRVSKQDGKLVADTQIVVKGYNNVQ